MVNLGSYRCAGVGECCNLSGSYHLETALLVGGAMRAKARIISALSAFRDARTFVRTAKKLGLGGVA